MHLSSNQRILLGVLSGVLVGLFLNQLASEEAARVFTLTVLRFIGQVFIDLLKMVLIPLVFLSIAAGVANLAAYDQGRKVWRFALLFFLTTSALAAGLGLTAANVFQPGKGLDVTPLHAAPGDFSLEKLSLGEYAQRLARGLFMNPVAAMAQGEVLATLVFALFVGGGLVACGERTPALRQLLNEAWALCMTIVDWIMQLAPWGIAALLAQWVATQNAALFIRLGKFVLVVVGSTLFHGIVLLPALLWAFAKISPTHFFRNAREALFTAFATASSSATLPVTLSCARQRFHINPTVSGFMLPLGATINMDGTALYEAAAALFVAQLHGIELDGFQQLLLCIVAMLASIGAPGIPSAGMVTLAMVFQTVGLPVEAIAILLPIDRLLDAFRTAVNVEGDLIGSLIVQRWVGGEENP